MRHPLDTLINIPNFYKNNLMTLRFWLFANIDQNIFLKQIHCTLMLFKSIPTLPGRHFKDGLIL